MTAGICKDCNDATLLLDGRCEGCWQEWEDQHESDGYRDRALRPRSQRRKSRRKRMEDDGA